MPQIKKKHQIIWQKYFKLLVALLFISITACKKERKLTGEGLNKTEPRPEKVQKENIQNVKINGSTTVFIIHGDVYDLEVKGYANLVNAIKTEVTNNTLVIEYPSNYNIINNNAEVRLTIPTIPNVSISGSSNTTVIGNFPNKNDLKFQISGSGEIGAGIGNIKNMEMNISGSGKIDAYNFISNNVKAVISGSGEIKTSALDNLKAVISGSGQVKYYGNPIVDSEISGSGTVIKVQ